MSHLSTEQALVAEVMDRTVNVALQVLKTVRVSFDWEDAIDAVQLANNSSLHSAHGRTP